MRFLFLWGVFWPQTTGRIVVIFAEMKNSGEDWARWEKSELNFGHVGLKCLLDIEKIHTGFDLKGEVSDGSLRSGVGECTRRRQ